MPVVINEMDVVVSPPPTPAAPSSSAGSKRQPTLTSADIDEIVGHFEARRARITAD